MKKILSFIILMVCAVTGAWADTSAGLENGTTGQFFLYESGTPADHSLNANPGDKAIIGAETYQSGKKWTPIEKSDAGTNVQYQNDQNWITNNAQNGNPGDVVAVPNGESEYEYYIKVVSENGTKGTWEGPLSTAPEGVGTFIDINPNQVNQYQNESMQAGTYYYRVSVPLYNYYKKVRYWEPKTLTGRQEITYYEAGTDVSTLPAPTNDGSKLAIGGDYWYAANGVWIQDGGASDGDYIQWNEETKVYDVHVTSAGSLTNKFQILLSGMTQDEKNALTGKVFRFDSECANFTATDLQTLAPANGPYLYLDFYDVAATTEIETAIEDAIKGNNSGISKLADNQQFQGLLLPNNPDKIGTASLILNSGKSPVKDFVAYNNGSTTTAHIYDTSASDESKYEPKVEKLKQIMDAHNNIASNTTVYLVSTNCKTPIGNVDDIKGTSTTASIVHTYNNEMVSGTATEPSIEVIPSKAGDYATLNEATNMRNTPNTETLKFKGNINADDILAVNSFTQTHWDNTTNSYVENNPKVYNGPRVLDLSEVPASQITQSLLNNLENPEIQYIILPAGMDAPVVGDYAKLTSLKCVISSNKSSDEAHVLTAYVRTAGSLAKARCLATGNKQGGEGSFEPEGQGLTTVKLMGNLNASDIKVSGAAGNGLSNEVSTITTLDLEDAIFANVNDMILNNSAAGFGDVLQEVKLPNNENMTEIPEEFLFGLSSIHNLHIPYYYKKIGWKAFYETGIDHITTEDANGALIDNGEKTYTFSANIEELGAPDKASSGQAVFPHDSKITDVYCLATKVPTCYASTFAMQVTFANGGANDGPYCREKYITSEDGGKVIAVLHFPNEESFNNVKNAEDKETNYATMKSLYTDPERVFTKKDQTGAVDTEGNPLLWPDQKELESSYYSAQAGHIWTDYELKYASDGHMEGLGALKNSQTQPFYPNYVGWHEFVLSQANYVDPDETVINEVVERKYEDAGWYTICIPYNLTRSQVLNMMGVPASNSKIKNYLLSKNVTNNTTTYGEVTTDLMPDIRQLKAVTRKKKGENDSQNQVKFFLTKNLYGYDNNKPTHTSYLDFTEIDGNKTSFEAVDADGTNNSDPICLVGGRPYIIKIYKRQGVTISQQNIGKYIMTHYGDELGLSASCLNNGSDYYEQLLDENETAANKKLVTLQFVKPYEKHLVQAVVDGESMTPVTYTEGGATYRYYYAMQGQFWDQDLPEYCFYISKGKWFHYMDKSKNYKWNAYKCVIMATPLEVVASNPVIPGTAAQVVEKQKIDAVTKVIGDLPIPEADKPTVKAEVEKGTAGALSWTSHWGVGFRWYPFCWFPQPETDTTDLLKSNFRLGFMGRDDDDFDKRDMARYIFDFEGDSVVEYDEDGNETTAIDMLDGEPQLTGKSDKVYSISGQYMGKTTENLPKGIYVVSGRKIVVD